MVKVTHEKIGDYYRHRPMLDFSRSRTRARAGARGGGNTRAVLSELGYDAAWIDESFGKGILWEEQ